MANAFESGNAINHADILSLCRQYYQLVPVNQIRWPSSDVLKLPENQEWLYQSMFDMDRVKLPLPPERYRLQFLRHLISLLENAFQDVDNDTISDQLVESLAMFMTQPAISELEATQKKVHVTYSFPSGSGIDRTVTVLESPNVVAASGTTGTRTWNASLHLGTYLATMGNDWVCGKRILELGAGTGLISALCAKHLQAKYVLATDGNHEIVTALDDNMFLNQLVDPNLIQCRLLRWGTNIEEGEDGETMQIDTVLGADLAFDTRSFPLLVASFRIILASNSKTNIIIAVAIRRDETFASFITTCERAGFSVRDLGFDEMPSQKQNGPFYVPTDPIRIFKVESKSEIKQDPYAFMILKGQE